MRLDVTTPYAGAVLPVSVAEVKAALRIEHTAHDALIERLIEAANNSLGGRRGFTRRAIMQETYTLYLRDFPAEDYVLLPLPPVTAVNSVKYMDVDNAEQTLSTDVYELVPNVQGEFSAVRLKYLQTWPGVRNWYDSVYIEYTAGYATANDVPEEMKQLLIMRVAELYSDTGDSVDEIPISNTLKSLLYPWRVQWLGGFL